MTTERGHRFGMEEYDMEEYWDIRAGHFDQDQLKPVCMFAVPKQVNQFFDALQTSLLKRLLDRTGDLRSKKVLEIGCGVGRWVDLLTHKGAAYTGVDISQRMVEIARQKAPAVEFFRMPADALGFDSESFDIVFSVTVLHHMPYEKQQKAIEEMSRVAKRTGCIVIMEGTKQPTDAFNMFANTATTWRSLFEQGGYKAYYSQNHQCIVNCKLFSGYLLLTQKVKFLRAMGIPFRVFVLLEKMFSLFLPQRCFLSIGLLFRGTT